jgi:hypothetical protein
MRPFSAPRTPPERAGGVRHDGPGAATGGLKPAAETAESLLKQAACGLSARLDCHRRVPAVYGTTGPGAATGGLKPAAGTAESLLKQAACGLSARLDCHRRVPAVYGTTGPGAATGGLKPTSVES